MKFEELEKLLNEEIENSKELKDSRHFDDKQDLKRWLAKRIKEIITEKIGEKYLSQSYEDRNTKLVVDYPWSGKENYVLIKLNDYTIATINFKFAYSTSYEHWWRNTRYGIRSVTIEYSWKSDNIIDCIEECKQQKIADDKETLEYRNKEFEKAKKFFESKNITIDDVNKAINLLCFIPYDERERYEKELNKGKEASWYAFRR